MSTVKVEQNKNIIQAQFHRPKTRNAINFSVMHELETLLTDIEADGSTRALIFKGSENIFISGGDLREFHTLESAAEAKKMAFRMLDILDRIERLPCWTIASVNAPAYGGGWEMMLAFDFRIASADATFGFTQGKFYLSPGWGGLTRLIDTVGRSTALKLLAEAATIDAETAFRHKLIDDIHDPENLDRRVLQFAKDISRNDRTFIRNLKLSVLRHSESRRQSMEAEIDAFGELWENDQHQQRVEKFLNRNSNRE